MTRAGRPHGELAARRRNVELRLREVQEAIGREVGTAPRRRGWLVTLVVGAAGFALAWAIRERVLHGRRQG